jgi:hypothetical protein
VQTRLSRSSMGISEESTCPRCPVSSASLVTNYILRSLTNSCHRLGLVGGRVNPTIGTFSTYCIVLHGHVIQTPAHLDDVRSLLLVARRRRHSLEVRAFSHYVLLFVHRRQKIGSRLSTRLEGQLRSKSVAFYERVGAS